ncbi:hypothetical protein OB905_11760 [Halobacteria archaeon AArc-dxtr1]|nr:hypothetical protein [Halobacteria archaeon AArc-dxtr1]
MTVPIATVLAGTRLRAAATGVAAGWLGGSTGDSDLPIIGNLNSTIMLLLILVGAVVALQLLDKMPSGGN